MCNNKTVSAPAVYQFQVIKDLNLMSKVIALVARNAIEDFHHDHHFPDRLMPEFNQMARNVVFTYLTDHPFVSANELAGDDLRAELADYIVTNIYPILFHNGYGHPSIAEEALDSIFDDVVNFLGRLSGLSDEDCDKIFHLYTMIPGVPSYWEDCIYIHDGLISPDDKLNNLLHCLYSLPDSAFTHETTQNI